MGDLEKSCSCRVTLLHQLEGAGMRSLPLPATTHRQPRFGNQADGFFQDGSSSFDHQDPLRRSDLLITVGAGER